MLHPAPASCATLFAALLAAQDPIPEGRPRLDLGDPAPAWAADTWLHGDAVAALQRGVVYYVEFWATWCVPCVQSMPKLTLVQRTHPEPRLVVIGISIDRDKPVADLRTFVDDQVRKDRVAYRVAWDSTDAMNRNWLQAAGISGIPTAMIVDGNGKLAFVGSPADAAAAVDKILAGGWDLEQARRDRHARRDAAHERAAQDRALQEQFLQACRERKWDAADAALDAIEKVDGYLVGFDQDRLTMLLHKNEREAAWRLAWRRTTHSWGRDPDMLGIVVQSYAFDARRPLDERERTLVWQAAARAAAASDDRVAVLSCIALAHFAAGDAAEAVRLQQEALAAFRRGEGHKDAPPEMRPNLLEHYEHRLNSFEQARDQARSAGK